MRALIFLLVLANLGFFAWAQGYFGASHSPDAVRAAQQINPDRLRIVARGTPPPASATPTAPPAAREACLVWGGLIASDADRLTRTVTARSPSARVARNAEATEAKAWWVFIPPLPTRAEADRKATELRRLEISDIYVVQEPGPNRLAVSLGVFSTEASARAYLETLRAKAVRTARTAPRGGAEPHFAVEVRGPDAELFDLREALAGHSPAECRTAIVAEGGTAKAPVGTPTPDAGGAARPQ